MNSSSEIDGDAQSAAWEQPPALVLARRERSIDDAVWFDAKSWIGGLPKLGDEPWPRDDNGRPLHFMAQLDLGEIAIAGQGRTRLPTQGAFAFFVGLVTGDSLGGRILHLKQPGAAATPAPADLGDVEDIGGDPFIAEAKQNFPYWPVEFRPLPPSPRVDAQDDEAMDRAIEAQSEAIGRLYPRRELNFQAEHVAKEATAGDAKLGLLARFANAIRRLITRLRGKDGGLRDVPMYWLAAHMFAVRVPKMLENVVKAQAQARDRGRILVDGATARLKALKAGGPPPAGQPAFGDVVIDRVAAERILKNGRDLIANADAREAAVRNYMARVAKAVKGGDPYRRLKPRDAARLDALFGEAHGKAFEDLTRLILPRNWREYASDAIKLMAAGPHEVYARLPEAWRALINTRYRTPIRYQHLMFGLGENIQGNKMFERPDMRMLLQLGFDDIMYWPFGDNGVYQFWMPGVALRKGDVAKAEVTFEAH